jgi:hypothetical protein
MAAMCIRSDAPTERVERIGVGAGAAARDPGDTGGHDGPHVLVAKRIAHPARVVPDHLLLVAGEVLQRHAPVAPRAEPRVQPVDRHVAFERPLHHCPARLHALEHLGCQLQDRAAGDAPDVLGGQAAAG